MKICMKHPKNLCGSRKRLENMGKLLVLPDFAVPRALGAAVGMKLSWYRRTFPIPASPEKSSLLTQLLP